MRYFFIGIFYMFQIGFLTAQNIEKVVEAAMQGKQISDLLLPLVKIQELALQNSPMLKFYKSDIKIGKYKVDKAKRIWWYDFGIEAGVRYGVYEDVLLTEEFEERVSDASRTDQVRYNLGIYLKMPFGNVVDKSKVKQLKAEVEKARFQVQTIEKEIRQLVIRQYNEVIRANKSLEIRQKSMQMFKLHMLRMDKDFINGKVDISDYSRIHDMATRAELDYEKFKSELRLAILTLNETVGITVTL